MRRKLSRAEYVILAKRKGLFAALLLSGALISCTPPGGTPGGTTTIYAATSDGLSISTNGGGSYTNYTTGLGNVQVKGVTAVGGTIDAATTGGLSISSASSISFTNYTAAANHLGSDLVNSVFVSGSTIYAVYVLNSKIYAAVYGGLSISSATSISFTDYATSNGLGSAVVNGVFVSGSTIYAATGATSTGGLAISTDGGYSFTNATAANGLGSVVVNGVFVD